MTAGALAVVPVAAAVADAPGLIAAFGGGMLSFLSPCVLPLVPGYVSLISGVSVAELHEGDTLAVTRVVRSTLLFVAGFTLVFVALGAAASSLGSVLRAHQRGLEQIAGAAVIVMGLFLAGVVSPRLLRAERRFQVSASRLGSWGPPVMGMAFAFGWTPCIGPILGGVLTLAETEATLRRGVALLLAYSLGLGVPFVATGLAFGRMTTLFTWARRHFRAINLVAGTALAAFGVLLLTNQVSWLSSQFSDAMRAMGLDRLSRS